MANPTTSIGFSPSTPAADSGFQNVIPRGDGGTPLARESFEVPNTGGAAVKTANYAVTAGDCGKLLVFNSSSAVTLTLPASIPFVQWNIEVQNIGAGALTVSPNGLDLDGSGSSLTLAQSTGIGVSTDGANYFSERGASAGGGSTFYFGQGSATASGGENEVILGSTPLTNSVLIFVGGTLTVPSSISGSTVTLPSALTSGNVVFAMWATTNSTPGGITLSASAPTAIEYWPMNEGSGTTFFDATANANNFTFSSGDGSWGTVPGLGTAFTFNGTGLAIGTNDTVTNFDGTDPFSVSLWVVFTTIPNSNLIGGAVASNAQGYGVRMASSNPSLILIDGSSGQLAVDAGGLSLATNTLYHFVWTYNGSKTPGGCLFYLNGVNEGLSTTSNTLSGSTATGAPLQMAGFTHFGGFLMNAAMGRVRMYSQVLTQAQVTALYNGGVPF